MCRSQKKWNSRISFQYLPVEDLAPISSGHIRQGVDFIRAHKAKGVRVLVACGAGINRSSSFCAAALKEEDGLSLFEAFKEVKRLHPEVCRINRFGNHSANTITKQLRI